MNRKILFSGLAAGALALGSLAAVLPGASASTSQSTLGRHAVHVCSTHPKPNHMTCLAMAIAGADGKIVTGRANLPVGFNAADIQKAYNLVGLKSHGATVAIVDAYAYPTLESDLKKFREQNGLSPCTINSGCLTVLGQDGGDPPDEVNAGWDLEQALDLDMVSAACPDCKLVMVQSNDNSFKSIAHAVMTAAEQKGVLAISNSYGAHSEGRHDRSPWYFHPGIAVVASTGDSGFQAPLYPATDTHVVGIGGTSVFKDSSKRGFHESVWSGAGSGCSLKYLAPGFQDIKDDPCKGLDAMADVSGAADPSNGGLLIIYNGQTQQVGGTSESAPLIAAVYALSGNTAGFPGEVPWKDPSHLYDVTTGTNGTCTPAVLCTAGKGWDGPTGLGTPNGVKSF